MTDLAELADEIRARLTDPIEIARQCGRDDGARRQAGGLLILCPWHDERTPSCSLKVGPRATLVAHCFGCGRSGDVVGLWAAVRGLSLDRREQYTEVLAELAHLAGIAVGGLQLPPRPPAPAPAALPYPDQAEVLALWNASARCDARAGDVADFLARRGLEREQLGRLDVARVLPPIDAVSWPEWWPGSRTRIWRLGLLAYTPRGEVASLHARAVRDAVGADGRVLPKTLWPRGRRSDGLLFVDRRALGILRGQSDAMASVVVEGATDFWSACCDADSIAQAGGPQLAVIGAASGGFAALAAVAWPVGHTIYVATDPDLAGERYAQRVREALPLCDVRRVDLRTVAA